MENDQNLPTTSSGGTSSTSTSNGRQQVPQISVYSGVPDRQTVQVIQQALHRQPNTAAQYLQQMYAAQQQHLMLQTAALQQQHLSSAQLQSLAAVQQASLAASRQGNSSNGNVSQQTGSSQTTINLAASPAAAQLINRAQSVNSAAAAASGIAQQAVLLGNATTPTLTASQAQMYLRAQMAQQSNLVQVARTLGRAVPLSPQLIFTPTATVTAVQPEVSTQSTSQPSAAAQVQNLAIRSQQTSVSASAQTQLQSLAMKPALSSQPAASAAQGKSLGQGPMPGAKIGQADSMVDSGKKGDGGLCTSTGGRGINVSRTATPVTSHPLYTSAYTQIQPHQLIQQQQIQLQQQHQKQIQHQFVIQQQQIQQRTQPQLIHSASANTSHHLQPLQPLQAQPLPQQPQVQTQTITIQPTPHTQSQIQAQAPPQAQAQVLHPPHLQLPLAQQKQALQQPVSLPPPVLQPVSQAPEPAIQNGKPEALNLPQAPNPPQQQASAVNLQVQPTINTPQRSPQEGIRAEKTAPAAEKRTPEEPAIQQATSTLTSETTPQQRKDEADNSTAPGQEQESVLVKTAPASQTMTSGTGSSAVTVTGSTPQNGENKPPQAIVKPQILTHVIEGFVIQEGAEPFPVGRSSLLVGNLRKQKYPQQSILDPEKPPLHQNTPTDSEMEELSLQDPKDQEDPPKLKCELCGRVDFAYKFKRSKRFCSMACAKRYNVGCTKRVGLFHSDRSKLLQKSQGSNHGRRRSRKSSLPNLNKDPKKQMKISVPAPLPLIHSQEDSSRGSDNSSYEEPLSPISASSSTSRRRQNERDLDLQDLMGMGHHFLPSDPTKWNVEDVYEFIRTLPGCQEIAEEFRSQEIDGQALLLLKEDHLMSTMNIKLGPALKIYARISMLKDS
ncbi:polyhomeotic-like protein 2 [Latimeria chalumnae]|uniref:polyhomeotic-like protein 2 n=1 Tax=Latimeria chalumnae TaxID=7897 RepID=UPI0003C1566C|nr:PREDICTED: polyhomeotic-like protein 2 isoform X2 [Latimeria chalumnae]|eukprot:XP_014353687.1 PREDICTED: polyhomeotic-like protein 2 isoform X2 [Latimeria chalumnae]